MKDSEMRRGTLSGGFGLMCRNWRCLTWAYFFNLLLAGIATLPLFGQTGPLMDHSLQARHISGLLDLGSLGGAVALMGERPSGMINGTLALDIVFVLVLFLFTPAVLSIYLGDELASLGNMFRVGLRYLWRMVRLGLVFLVIGGIPLGILSGIRAAMLTRLDARYVERDFFLWELATGLVVLFVAIIVRLWFDLAQVVLVERGTYRIGRVESRSAWRAIGPAWRLLRVSFWKLFLSFALIDVLGWGALLLALFAWHAAPPESTLAAFLLGQVGVFLLLTARFWQRGLEVDWFAANAALVVPPVTPLVAPEIHPYVADPVSEPVVVVPVAAPPAVEPIDPLPPLDPPAEPV